MLIWGKFLPQGKENRMDNKKTTEKSGLFSGVRRAIGEESERRKTSRGALLCDIALFTVAFFFARRHFIFGSYPLAGVLVATLPSHVWITLFGSALGSVTLGRSGIVQAINSLIIVFIRIILSSGEGKDENGPTMFREPYVMRVAAAAISSTLSGVYNVLISGLTISVIFEGVFGILFSVAVSIALYGVFAYGVGLEEMIYGTKNIFLDKKSEREKWGLASFSAGLLALCYLIGFSLSEYDFFGISLSYIFSASVTLFSAKRFGPVRAMAAGFASALGFSATGAVAFALAGLAAGALFKVGFGYAVIGGGALLILWGAYNGGVMGVLSLFPEYSVSAMILYPFLKNAASEHSTEESESLVKLSREMVDDMAAERRREDTEISEIEEALSLAAGAIKEYGSEDAAGEFEEYRNILIAVTSLFSPGACEENIDLLATKLYKKQKITSEDVVRLLPDVSSPDEFIEEIYRLSAEYERDSVERRRMDAVAREYEIISKMINDARVRRSDAGVCDDALSERLFHVFSAAGFPDGALSVLGTRKRRIIGAGEDKDGSLITAPVLKEALEEEGGFKLGKFKFYRRGDIALFEAVTEPMWTVEYAICKTGSRRGEISGDTAEFFEYDSIFYSLISDGMGSGRVAERTSRFVAAFLKRMLTSEATLNSALAATNHLIRHRGEECSATVDLFSLDLLTGDAHFIKSGAAPSFLKREGSLFRIKSQTAPIGLMKEVDSEKIRVEVKRGDYIIMLSDGAYLLPDDAVWLFEFLSRPAPDSTEEFAQAILSAAKKNSGVDDDITVSVVKIL